MTDTKESHYQDRADLEAENAKLRADIAETIRQWKCVWTGAEPTTAAECMRLAENSAAILRGKLGDAWGEVHKLRAELDALRAAPSAEEIEAWRRSVTARNHRGELAKSWDVVFLVASNEVDEAVALMRRATAAPAQSAREDVCAALDKVRDWFDFDDEIAAVMWKHDALSRIASVRGLAESPRRCDNCGAKLGDSEVTCHQCGCGVKIGALAAPDAKEPSGVEAPEDVTQPKPAAVKIDRSEFRIANGVKFTADDALKLLGKDIHAYGVWCRDPRDGDWFVDGWRELSQFYTYFTAPKIINAGTGEPVVPAAQHPAAALDDTRRSERAEADGLQRLLSSASRSMVDGANLEVVVGEILDVLEALCARAGAK